VVAVSLLVDVLKLAYTRLKTKLKMQANTSYGVLGAVSVISFFNFDQEVELTFNTCP